MSDGARAPMCEEWHPGLGGVGPRVYRCHRCPVCAMEHARDQAEAERDALRDDKAELEHLHRVNREECVALRAEVENWKKEHEAMCIQAKDAREQQRKLRAEVERLREALSEVQQRTAVGPPSPPGMAPTPGSLWYDRLVRVNLTARKALAAADTGAKK